MLPGVTASVPTAAVIIMLTPDRAVDGNTGTSFNELFEAAVWKSEVSRDP